MVRIGGSEFSKACRGPHVENFDPLISKFSEPAAVNCEQLGCGLIRSYS